MARDRIPTTFVGSDGTYYTRADLVREMANDAWRYRMRDRETGQELFETERGNPLANVPTNEAEFAMDEGHGRQDW